MTNEEAIEVLQGMKSDFPLPKAAQTRRAQNDALDAAIKALKAEPCEDAVSRQAAIDVIEAGRLTTVLIEEISGILKRMCMAENILQLNAIQSLANRRIFELWTIRCEELKRGRNERPGND